VRGEALHLTWISSNVSEMMGYTAREALPNWWHRRVHPADLQRVLSEIRQRLQADGQLAHEYRFRHQNSEYRWVRSELRLLRDAVGQPVEIVGSPGPTSPSPSGWRDSITRRRRWPPSGNWPEVSPTTSTTCSRQLMW
jgi:hypothetical protein